MLLFAPGGVLMLAICYLLFAPGRVLMLAAPSSSVAGRVFYESQASKALQNLTESHRILQKSETTVKLAVAIV